MSWRSRETKVNSSSTIKSKTYDDSYSESGDEFDREIARLEEEIRQQKLEMVRRKEMAKRNKVLMELQKEHKESRKPILAEMKTTQMVIENAQKATESNRNNTDSLIQTMTMEYHTASSSNTRTVSYPSKPAENNTCVTS